jgi:hypothetical protein
MQALVGLKSKCVHNITGKDRCLWAQYPHVNITHFIYHSILIFSETNVITCLKICSVNVNTLINIILIAFIIGN